MKIKGMVRNFVGSFLLLISLCGLVSCSKGEKVSNIEQKETEVPIMEQQKSKIESTPEVMVTATLEPTSEPTAKPTSTSITEQSAKSKKDTSSNQPKQPKKIVTSTPAATKDCQKVVQTERFETEEYSFEIPASWKGRYATKNKKDIIEFYHIRSRKMGAEGSLCWILTRRETTEKKVREEVEKASWFYYLGGKGSTYYIMEYPTDVEIYEGKKEIQEEYGQMECCLKQIVDTFQVK